jgi:hypothetical protein
VLGLFIGTAHLVVILNATVRSLAGKWGLGAVVAVMRIVLLIALVMANSRIRSGAAEATSALTAALYAGPALSLTASILAFFRRQKLVNGSEDKRTATTVMRAWLTAASVDVLLLVVSQGLSSIG